MNFLIGLTEANLAVVVLFLAIVVLLLLIFLIILGIKLGRLKRRYEIFTGSNKRPERNFEKMIVEYKKEVDDVKHTYRSIMETVEDISANMNLCTQKVGVVRYNPYEEMGGNLSFAVAILDANDDGFVLNGIHSRTGTYTYVKPVEMGVSAYILSQEEEEAIALAQKNGYQPKERVKYEKTVRILRRRKKEQKQEQTAEETDELLRDNGGILAGHIREKENGDLALSIPIDESTAAKKVTADELVPDSLSDIDDIKAVIQENALSFRKIEQMLEQPPEAVQKAAEPLEQELEELEEAEESEESEEPFDWEEQDLGDSAVAQDSRKEILDQPQERQEKPRQD